MSDWDSLELVEVAQPQRSLDEIEAWIISHGGQSQATGEILKDFPVTHHFTPGLYIREIFMPAGSILTSRIHKTEHPYIITKGKVIVRIDGQSSMELAAPHFGITKPGTRRLLFILEDTTWLTFHATQLTDVVEIENEIIEAHHNPLLPTALQTYRKKELIT